MRDFKIIAVRGICPKVVKGSDSRFPIPMNKIT